MKIVRHNAKQLLIAIDQLSCCLVGIVLCEKVWADMTLSACAYIWDRDGVRSWPRKMIDAMFFWQDAHCESSYESEKERLQLPPELR